MPRFPAPATVPPPPLPTRLLLLAWLGFSVVAGVSTSDPRAPRRVAWTLALFAFLPLLALGLLIAAAWPEHPGYVDTIPATGETIPGAGR